MNVNTLKPGLLVSLKTTLRGGIAYQRRDIETAHREGNATVAQWETRKEISDSQEYESAVQARGKARSLITQACCASSFGLLCPQDKEIALQDAIEQARELTREFNRNARLSRIEVYVLVGRIAQDSSEAQRAIASEMRGLLADMEDGIKRADVEQIRKAANAAKGMQEMLSDSVASKVDSAITQARQAARDIVRRVGKAGEAAADVVQELNVSRIERARFSFLDTSEGQVSESSAPIARAVEMAASSTPMSGYTPASFNLEV